MITKANTKKLRQGYSQDDKSELCALADQTENATPTKQLRVHGAMLISAFLVSTSFTVVKAITPLWDPLLLTCCRFVLASALFLALVRLRQKIPLPSLADFCRYSLISATLVLFFWLMFAALRSTTPLNTAVIFTTVPGISGIYSWLLLRERLPGQGLIALVLAMIGALWVLCDAKPSRLLALQFSTGDLVFFSGCLLMAAYTPLVKYLYKGESMQVMTLWVLITGSFWLLLLSIPKIHLFFSNVRLRNCMETMDKKVS